MHIVKPNKQTLYETLRRQHYVNVPFPMDRHIIEEAVQAFFKFLEEPESVKKHIAFSINLNHRRGEVGFIHRDPNDNIYNDSKDFFHYHPALFEKYPEFLDTHPVVRAFVLKAKPIWTLVYQVAKDILSNFEQDFPGGIDKIFKTEYPHILLRFLKYDWQNSEAYLAKPHFDAGSFTLAIAESCKGLRIGSCPADLQIVEHQVGNAVFMLSSNFKKVMDIDLSPGWHDVIQMDKTMIGKPFARWAVVAFIEAHGVEAQSRDVTHKWYTPAT